MTPLLCMVAVMAELFLVAGQIVVKRSMLLTNQQPVPRGRFVGLFGVGIGALSMYFFLWLGLMGKLDLSQQYPFDALAPLLLVFAAVVFLKERLTARSWAGIGLVAAGLGVIAFS